MIFRLVFEYEVEDEAEGREIRDAVSPLVHDMYKVDRTPDNWFYEFTRAAS